MNTVGTPGIAPLSVDPTCAYHPECQCYKQTRHQFSYAHVGEQGAAYTGLLTRDEIADMMVDLLANKSVNRMWIQSTPDRASFLWFAADADSRIGDWCVDWEGHTYCFQWTDSREEVHCGTLGEWFGPIDPFGQRRWSSHRAALMWTLDNIHHIATRD